MRILHITPHLGGGVGNAHAAIGRALPKGIERTFVLLEEPRDPRYANLIAADGALIVIVRNLDDVAELAADADVVQFEFWNHPRLFECLARGRFSAMRTVFWSHVSGLGRPVIQPALIEEAGRFVFTTEASRAIPSLGALSAAARHRLAVVNSGFGFADTLLRVRRERPVIAYLGTVDFIKMHPGFFDAIDRLEGNDVRVAVWGSASAEVMARAKAMRHPERVRLAGQTGEPAVALAGADIFFYPLQRDHYGTAENALVEAMSLGLVPVVLDNPAERAIVRHGETGLVGKSIEECAELLQHLLASPDLISRLSKQAARDVAMTRTPQRAADDFVALWKGLRAEPARRPDFSRAVGERPADWFLATQCLPGDIWDGPDAVMAQRPAKGMLAHFQSAFPDDPSLSELARARRRIPNALQRERSGVS